MIFYNYSRQRMVNREDGVIVSITPLYDNEQNKYDTFYKLLERMTILSKEFPQEKLVAEMQNVSEKDFEILKSDIGIGDNFVDHVSKFYLSVGLNVTIIVNKIY